MQKTTPSDPLNVSWEINLISKFLRIRCDSFIGSEGIEINSGNQFHALKLLIQQAQTFNQVNNSSVLFYFFKGISKEIPQQLGAP